MRLCRNMYASVRPVHRIKMITNHITIVGTGVEYTSRKKYGPSRIFK